MEWTKWKCPESVIHLVIKLSILEEVMQMLKNHMPQGEDRIYAELLKYVNQYTLKETG